MDHQEQHHQHHQMERQEKIKEEKRHEGEAEKRTTPIHPAWFFVLAAVLVVVAMAIWILVF